MAAVGMVVSVVVSVVFGFLLLLAVTFAIPDTQGVIDAGGYAVTYIWETSMSQGWAEFLLFIAVVAQMFCLTASLTSASRMMYAFSRDGAVPGHRIWRRISGERVPLYAVMALGVLAWLLMVPTLWNAVVGYLVGTSIAVIGLFDWNVVKYAPLTVGGAFLLFGGWFLLSARKWFKGPVRQGTEEELEQIEAQYGARSSAEATFAGGAHEPTP
jgi:amino acid transporter